VRCLSFVSASNLALRGRRVIIGWRGSSEERPARVSSRDVGRLRTRQVGSAPRGRKDRDGPDVGERRPAAGSARRKRRAGETETPWIPSSLPQCRAPRSISSYVTAAGSSGCPGFGDLPAGFERLARCRGRGHSGRSRNRIDFLARLDGERMQGRTAAVGVVPEETESAGCCASRSERCRSHAAPRCAEQDRAAFGRRRPSGGSRSARPREDRLTLTSHAGRKAFNVGNATSFSPGACPHGASPSETRASTYVSRPSASRADRARRTRRRLPAAARTGVGCGFKLDRP